MNIKQKNTGSNLRVIFSSEAARTGFTHIPNFQWSKLNQNNGFKLWKTGKDKLDIIGYCFIIIKYLQSNNDISLRFNIKQLYA